MATRTISVQVSEVYMGSDGNSYIADATVTTTFTTTLTDQFGSLTANNISVSAVTYRGPSNTTNREKARQKLATTLSSATATLTFDGQTVCSKTGLAIGGSYTISGTKSIARGTSATTANIVTTCGSKTTTKLISVPALQSWSIIYDSNSGTTAPNTHGIDITLATNEPNKEGYTFKGWATSAAIAGEGTVEYASSATYSENTKEDVTLYAIWEINYQKPIINNLHIDRCKGNGELDDDGTYAKVSFVWSVMRTNVTQYYGGNIAPYSNNTVSNCTIIVGDQTITPILTGGNGTASIVVGNNTFVPDESYDVSISITDSQTIVNEKTTIISDILSMSFFPMDINTDATAIGFFKPAPDNDEGAFFAKNVDAPTYTINGTPIMNYILNQLTDFVVEEGTDGIWTYRKWNSGIAECWGRYSVTLTKYTTAGSFAGYYADVPLPTGLFVSGSIPTHTYTATVGTGFAMPGSGMGTDNTNMKVYALGTASADNQSCVFDIMVKGRWK